MAVARRGAAVEIAGLRREYLSDQGSVVAIDHVEEQRERTIDVAIPHVLRRSRNPRRNGGN